MNSPDVILTEKMGLIKSLRGGRAPDFPLRKKQTKKAWA